MKPTAFFLAAACLAVSSGLAVASETDAAPKTALANAFAAPLTTHGEQKTPPPSEDLESPYVEAHQFEEHLYLDRYFFHYGAKPDNPDAPLPDEPPPPVDADGRPLWFDTGWGDEILNTLVARLVAHKQFDDVDRLFAEWNNSAERMADGRWKLLAFYDEYNVWLNNPQDWDATYQFIADWRKQKPGSAAAALAEAQYWYWYAWHARGSGYASSVTPEGWKLFGERLEKAQKVLTDSKDYAGKSPLWGRVQVEVGLGLNWPKEALLRVVQETSAKEPYFYPIYTAMVTALLPRWGGNWQLVDEFIRSAVKNTAPVDGYSLYARLYWTVDPCGCESPNLFNETLARWPEMKRSFEDLVARYPHSGWLANSFAAYACMADDRDTYVRLSLRIGKAVTADAWPQTHTLDLCDHKFPAQPL